MKRYAFTFKGRYKCRFCERTFDYFADFLDHQC